jgi:chemotaxis protein methyltransferase CheR
MSTSMMTAAATASPTLTDRDLRAIIALVYEKSGITLHDGKRALVAARLQKRLRQLGMSSYNEYLARLSHDRGGEELTVLLDAIATNHTSFFREPQHFAFLRDQVAPALADKARTSVVEGWCAASSSGEEPVTIAITLLEAGIERFRILSSDLSTKALTVARRGTYKVNRLQDVPPALLRKYFQRGLGAQEGLARVVPEVRQLIVYRALNLIAMDRIDRVFDFIFCRNVMIYFDKIVQQRVVSMLEQHLAPGAHLFISHSESLNGITHNMQWVAPAVYRSAP